MVESVGHHIALTPPLQSIIADGGGRLHGGFDIARLDELPLFLCVVRPHPGKAVGLQLNSNLDLITLSRIHTALRLLYPRYDANRHGRAPSAPGTARRRTNTSRASQSVS